MLEVKGDFKKDVRVAVPLGINLLRVTPREVIGTVESLAKVSLPVKASFLPLRKTNSNFLLSAETFPQTVAALGRVDLVQQAVAAIALTTVVEGDVKVPLYAADVNGQALSEIILRPSEVTLTVHKVPVFHSKEVPVLLEFSGSGNLKIQTSALSKDIVTLVGTSQQLENLTEAQASVDLSALGSGEHNLELDWTLPEDVQVLEPPIVN